MLRRAIRHTAILTAGILLGRVLNLGFRYTLARRMSLADYGQLALVFSATTYLSQIGTLNLGNAAARFIPNSLPTERAALSRALHRLCAWAAGLASIICVGVTLALDSRWTVAVLAGACVGAYAFQSLGEGVLRAYYKTGVQATAQIVTAATRLTTLVILVSLSAHPLRLNTGMVAFAAGSFLAWLLVTWSVHSSWPTDGVGLTSSPVPSRELLRFGGLLTVSSTVTLGLGFANRLLLKRFVGIEDVAHYDNALLAYSALQALLSSFVLVTVPAYAAASGSAVVPVIRPRRILAVFLLLYTLLLAAQVSGLTVQAFRALAVERYAPMYPVFLVVVLGFPFEFLFVSISSPLQARSKVLSVGVASCVAASAGLITACITIPRFGIAGAAVSSVVGATCLGVTAVFMRRIHGLTLELH
jgi:O-antigen/teichoic acid export membrane protein